MADLYHFYIFRKPGVTREQVEAILNDAPDWFRYHETCYIVDTSLSPSAWKTRLEPVFKPDGFLFICKLDKQHYQGWMQMSFWEWYQGKAPLAKD